MQKWLPAGHRLLLPGRKEASGNFDHWLEKALQVVTGPQEDEPKIGASPMASRGNANLAGGSAQVPRSSLVCDLIK